MGTRNLILVWYRGGWVVAQYGQWDGYPTGQGKDIVEFISTEGGLERLRAAFDNNMVYIVNQSRNGCNDGSPVAASLSAGIGAKILSLISKTKKPIPLVLQVNFIYDRLFCEWAYVLDLDENVLEVYAGSTSKEDSGRFADFEIPTDQDDFSVVGYPNLLLETDMDGLTVEKFLESVQEAEAEMEEEESFMESEQKDEDACIASHSIGF